MLLVIMRGVPGSGKSFSAQRIKIDAEDHGTTATIHSTDEKFMVDGNYRFDREKLSEYHRQNLNETIDSMMMGVDVVIVDNTNIRVQHFMPYVEAAKALRYTVKECQPDSPWWKDWRSGALTNDQMAEVCAKKNWHHVPIKTISVMLESFEEWNNVG